jgi:DNA polymerase-3 subunit delta'
MLIGQSRVEAMLSRALQRDRVSHAYLFLGPEGVGKATAALLLAQALNCERRPAPGEPGHPGLRPCGTCDACRRIAIENHPDVRVLTPQTRGGQNIGVEQARALRHDAQLRPKSGRRKVYVLPNAELLNEEAANTALKTLEEPNPFVTILLCAPAASSLLPTIQSRCQWVRFGLAAPEVIAQALANHGGVEPESAALLAHLAGGRPGLAFRWARDPAILARRAAVIQLFAEAEAYRQRVGADPGGSVFALRLAEEFRAAATSARSGKEATAAAAREDLRDALDFALGYYRDALALAEGFRPSTPNGRQQDAQDETDRNGSGNSALIVCDPLVDARSGAGWREMTEAIGTILESQRLLERNVTPQAVLERMFLRLLTRPE